MHFGKLNWPFGITIPFKKLAERQDRTISVAREITEQNRGAIDAHGDWPELSVEPRRAVVRMVKP